MHRGELVSEQVERKRGEAVLVHSPIVDKYLQSSSGDVTQYPITHPKLVLSGDLTETTKIYDLGTNCLPGEMSELDYPVEHMEFLPEDINKNDRPHLNKISEIRKDTTPHQISEDLPNGNGETGREVSNVLVSEEPKPTCGTGEKRYLNKPSRSYRGIVMGLPSRGQFETLHTRMAAKNSKSLRGGGKRDSLFLNKNCAPRSSLSCQRVLRSGSREKSKETASLASANSKDVVGRRKRGRGRKKRERREDDEYVRIKRNLRYLLNRINYEQSLITAYSSEGWKGLSLEKLKPEKELERASKEIFRRKLRIRDLFHHLDTLSAEGRLPQSLFDSEGEIASEDIFCAKCGSKDLSIDNDIILCDGVCDRGFHQYCLEPPLLKEHIPPGDECWLCPGCDCRFDCIDLLNESQGTRLSISDSWERIFPEAAAAATSGDQDPNFGLPSDDSDDDDYDPDALDDNKNDGDNDDNDDKESQEDEISDASDFTSASDEMLDASKVEQYKGLPSDDSEDDDYNPDAQCHDNEDVTQETSGSDFSSDFEDLDIVLKDDRSCQEDEDATPGESDTQKSQLRLNERQSITISESYASQDGSADVPQRRSLERLDYKKLYDEAYGNVPSSSSDDEDWDKIASSREEDMVSTEEMSRNEDQAEPPRQSSKVLKEHSPMKPREKSKRMDKTENLAVSQEGPEKNSSSGENIGSSAQRQRDIKAQRLYQVFEENRYPDNATKENLAGELGMTVKQVNTWFRNRRSYANGTLVRRVPTKDVYKLATSKEGRGEASITGCSQRVTDNQSIADHSSMIENSTVPGSRKRRR